MRVMGNISSVVLGRSRRDVGVLVLRLSVELFTEERGGLAGGCRKLVGATGSADVCEAIVGPGVNGRGVGDSRPTDSSFATITASWK